VNRIPWWTLGSAGAAPVFLIGGWTIAASLQPSGYDAERDTISALAAHGATDRWVMTAALIGAGAGYILTAAGLYPARPAGRFVLMAAGAGTIAVGLVPQPAHGTSGSHTIAAAISLVGLGAWPVFAARRDSWVPLLKPPVSVTATAALLGLVAWFALEIHGGQRGLAERAAAGSESLWPLAVVLSACIRTAADPKSVGNRTGQARQVRDSRRPIVEGE
jgi:hypothetical membrane protein